jgi:hypothetical protein
MSASGCRRGIWRGLFVIEAVAEMDLGALYAASRHDGHGRAAFEPAMMVALVL